MKENIQYAIVGQFLYSRPELVDLRRVIPQEFNIKGSCKIGYLGSKHTLVRFDLSEDYTTN